MMNYIWSGIFLSSFLYAALCGNISAFGTAIVESSQSAVTFVIGLAGIMAMWSGLMEAAERTGLIHSLARLLMPFTRLLFPKQKDPETLSCMTHELYGKHLRCGQQLNRLCAAHDGTAGRTKPPCRLGKQRHVYLRSRQYGVCAAGTGRDHSDSRRSRLGSTVFHRAACPHHCGHHSPDLHRNMQIDGKEIYRA